jgi:hypothetical protein
MSWKGWRSVFFNVKCCFVLLNIGIIVLYWCHEIKTLYNTIHLLICLCPFTKTVNQLKIFKHALDKRSCVKKICKKFLTRIVLAWHQLYNLQFLYTLTLATPRVTVFSSGWYFVFYIIPFTYCYLSVRLQKPLTNIKSSNIILINADA